MNSNKKMLLPVGIAVLVLVVLFLLASPGLFFASTVTCISTDSYKSTGEEPSIRTTSDFGTNAYMERFPLKIGKWKGVNYDTAKYKEFLGGDVMLVRAYMPSTFTQPVFFTLVQARTASSFHPPKVCFTSQGYKIQEETDESLSLKDASWVKSASSLVIPLKKLVIAKPDKAGKIIERRVVLFTYIKKNQYSSDDIALVETAGLIPLEGDYQDTLDEEKEFLTQAMPLMFEPAQDQAYQPVVVLMAGWGTAGYILAALLILVPAGMILFAVRSKRQLT